MFESQSQHIESLFKSSVQFSFNFKFIWTQFPWLRPLYLVNETFHYEIKNSKPSKKHVNLNQIVRSASTCDMPPHMSIFPTIKQWTIISLLWENCYDTDVMSFSIFLFGRNRNVFIFMAVLNAGQFHWMVSFHVFSPSSANTQRS